MNRMQFDAPQTRRTYSDRSADRSWQDWCVEHLQPAGKDVVDIGCGGGIYSFGFAALGARSVVGVDGSQQYIDEAQRGAENAERVSFRVSSAGDTGLADACADIVFERALIHHLSDVQKLENAAEARRLLRAHGRLCVQDRTFEDVQATHADFWIRSTLIETFPRLLDFEKQRRPVAADYAQCLTRAGFTTIATYAWPEVRRQYGDFAELRAEILSRKGKSILFELNDAELQHYCDRLQDRSATHRLVECDQWTIWLVQCEPS